MLIRWIGVLAWVTLAAVVWVTLIPQGLPWTGLVWLSVLGVLAFWAMHWADMRRTRSMAQLIDDVEAEPTLAVAAPKRATITGLRSKL